MEALRLLVTPQASRLVIELPEHLAHGLCEVIVMPAQDAPDLQPPPSAPSRPLRMPSPKLAGTLLRDDLTSPAVPAQEWSALE